MIVIKPPPDYPRYNQEYECDDCEAHVLVEEADLIKIKNHFTSTDDLYYVCGYCKFLQVADGVPKGIIHRLPYGSLP